jgi:hypothetical protein
MVSEPTTAIANRALFDQSFEWKETQAPQQTLSLFNHLVGLSKERR